MILIVISAYVYQNMCTHNPAHMTIFLIYIFISLLPAFVYVHMYSHDPAPMPIFLFYLYLHFSNSCVCVSNQVYT